MNPKNFIRERLAVGLARQGEDRQAEGRGRRKADESLVDLPPNLRE